jgi:hypothetical protein
LATVALFLIGTANSESMAMGEVPEDEVKRFEDLRATSRLTCNIWEQSVAVEFGIRENGPPSITESPGDDGSSLSIAFFLNEQRDSAIQFFGSDDLGIWANPIRLEPPVSSFLGENDFGAMVLPSPVLIGWFRFYDPEACLDSFTDCGPLFEILADPNYDTFFPLISSVRQKDRVAIFAGRCYPGVSEEFQQHARDHMAAESYRDEAFCGDPGAQFIRGAYSAMFAEVSGEELVEAYSWLRIASDRIPEFEPDEQELAARIVSIAIDIAAERLTPEQIAVAKRRAAAWKPDPSKCDKALEKHPDTMGPSR